MRTERAAHRPPSANLYQIFTYVKNKEAQLSGLPHEVSGLLLYAQTDEGALDNHIYRMSGNRIGVQTLDLNCPFPMIAAMLDSIAIAYLT